MEITTKYKTEDLVRTCKCGEILLLKDFYYDAGGTVFKTPMQFIGTLYQDLYCPNSRWYNQWKHFKSF